MSDWSLPVEWERPAYTEFIGSQLLAYLKSESEVAV